MTFKNKLIRVQLSTLALSGGKQGVTNAKKKQEGTAKVINPLDVSSNCLRSSAANVESFGAGQRTKQSHPTVIR